MKKVTSICVSICLVVLVMCSVIFNIKVNAITSGTKGNITWMLDGTILTFYGQGEMPDFDDSDIPWDTNITEVFISEGITSIGNNSFSRCDNLIKIILPDTVMKIGDFAFYQCSNLKYVGLPSNIRDIGYYAFAYCNSLTSIDLPDKTTRIGSRAFFNVGIKSITIPKSVTNIEPGAFSACDELTEMIVDEENSVYHSKGNSIIETDKKTLVVGCNVSVIPNDGSVECIGDSAFFYCRSIENIIIPDGVVTLSDNAFSDCYSLKKIIIPDSVRTFGSNIFLLCGNLEDMTIPNGVNSIGYNAFDRCDSLKSIVIPKSVTSIDGSLQTASCTSLTQLEVADGNSVYHSAGNCIIETKSKILVAGCQTSIIPNDGSVKYIGDSAFDSCINITNIIIPDSVITIGFSAFRYCNSLKNIMLPNTLLSISYYAFDECTRLVGVWYEGNEKNKDQIEICGDNQPLEDANWRYNACKLHSYSYVCDTSCDVCDFPRVSSKHTYSDSKDFICDVCDEAVEFDWSLNDTELIIRGKGNIPDYDIPWEYAAIKAPWGTDITKINIQDGIKSIGKYAFFNSTSLVSIVIPKSVTSIGDSAFDSCHSLRSVYYCGTAEQWNSVSIGSDNSYLTNAKVYSHKYDDVCDTDCNICGAVRTIPHYFKWIIDKAGNCVSEGIKHEECIICKVKRNEKTTIPTTGNHSYKTTTTKATTKNDGSIVKKCTVCGKVESNTTIKYVKTFKLSATSYTYDDKVKTPSITVKDSAGRTLKKGIEYTVTYASGRKNAGTYKVTVTMIGKYSGSKTLYFKINPAKLSSYKLSTTSYTYDGKVKTPSVTVKNSSGSKLTKNTHYTVTYASGRKNVGTYKVTIKGKGNYTGTKTLTYKINPSATTVSKLTAGKKSITVAITKKSTQVTGYQIQYSTSKTFSKATTKTISSYKTKKYTLKSLSAKKTYYVRVRTYKKVGSTTYYSGWSTYKYVKTK